MSILINSGKIITMAKIIDGNNIADALATKLKQQIVELGKQNIVPKLAIITYRADERSLTYVRLKERRAKEIGIIIELLDYSRLKKDQCLSGLEQLARDPAIHGIVVQLPLAGWNDPQSLLNLIPLHKDVDGLSDQSLEALQKSQAKLIPATPKAILATLEGSGTALEGKKIVVVGQGKLVGLPLSIILKNQGYDVEVANINTKNLPKLTQTADILISAVGKPRLITGVMVKPGAIVLDAGIVEVNGKLVGDVDYDSVDRVAGMVSKVPGGIGPVTVVSLLQNVVEASEHLNNSC